MVSCLRASSTNEDIQQFNSDITYPDATAAQNSGLWKLHALDNHWHLAVRKVAQDIPNIGKEPALVTSIINVPPLVEKYSAEGGGFNPPPQEKYTGKLKRRKNHRKVDVQTLIEGCDVEETSDECILVVLTRATLSHACNWNFTEAYSSN